MNRQLTTDIETQVKKVKRIGFTVLSITASLMVLFMLFNLTYALQIYA